MNSVFNWQLGRDMEYGYPHHWDVKTLDLLEKANPGGQTWNGTPQDLKAPFGHFKGKTVFEAAKTHVSDEGANRVLGYLPTDDEWSAPNRFEDNPSANEKGSKGQLAFKGGELGPQHKTWFFYLARLCNHCTYPACLAACPRNAIFKRPEDGIVLVDQERCRGYRKCMEACPYKKTLYRGTTRTSEKCIACFPRIEGRDQQANGLPMQTRLHGRLCWTHPPSRPRSDQQGRRLERGSLQPALLSDSRGQSRAATLPAVWHRAERLLHPTALGAALVSHRHHRRGAFSPERRQTCQLHLSFRSKVSAGPSLETTLLGLVRARPV